MKWLFTRFGYRGCEYYYVYDTKEEALEAEKRLKERQWGVSCSLGVKRISDKKAAKIKKKEWEETGKYWMIKE